MTKAQRRDNFINGPVYSSITTRFRLINDLVEEYTYKYTDPWYGLTILKPNPSSTVSKIEKAMSIYEFIGDDPRLHAALADALNMLVQYKSKCDSLGISYDEKLVNSITEYVKAYTNLIIEFETTDELREQNNPVTERSLQNEPINNLGVISISKELRELKALLDEGILTQEEFKSMKNVILRVNRVDSSL